MYEVVFSAGLYYVVQVGRDPGFSDQGYRSEAEAQRRCDELNGVEAPPTSGALSSRLSKPAIIDRRTEAEKFAARNSVQHSLSRGPRISPIRDARRK